MLNADRPRHKHVMEILGMLSSEFLQECECYFAGGTRIVLELDEYRESLDLDFMCATVSGYKQLRNEISAQSLGSIFSHHPDIAREVRADMYGIRTFLNIGGAMIKFEIIREARIPLHFTIVDTLPVPCLDHASCFAEKFLANTDRGLDTSTRSRDYIDLAFMAARWSVKDLNHGLAIAQEAYGASVLAGLSKVQKLFGKKTYRQQVLSDLNIKNPQALDRGTKKLSRLI